MDISLKRENTLGSGLHSRPQLACLQYFANKFFRFNILRLGRFITHLF
jgi:hypothetical protein